LLLLEKTNEDFIMSGHKIEMSKCIFGEEKIGAAWIEVYERLR